jgi:hypothetical protein
MFISSGSSCATNTQKHGHGSWHRITDERLPATDKPKREKIAKLE